MNCSVIGQSTFIFSFLYIKLVFVSVESVNNTGIRDLMDSRGEKFQTKQVEINLRAEDTDYASFLDSFIQPARIKKLKIVQRILGNYKRKNVPVNHDRLEENIRQALEQHIEEMEPNFRSASFLRLWQELRKPLTDVIRPQKLEEMLGDLDKCKLDNVQDFYKFPYDVDNIQRDLTICKICEILVKETESSSAPDRNGSNYVYMWSLLKNPLTRCFKIARLSLLMEELGQCLPRFELAGIKYKMPSKMSEVKRDVIICKVDEVLNEPFGYDEMLGSAKEPLENGRKNR